MLLAVRHEATINHDKRAPLEARRRKYPIARATACLTQRRAAASVNQGFAIIEELRRHGDAKELICLSRKEWPIDWLWQSNGGCRQALFRGCDQPFLPSLAIHLPQPKQHQNH